MTKTARTAAGIMGLTLATGLVFSEPGAHATAAGTTSPSATSKATDTITPPRRGVVQQGIRCLTPSRDQFYADVFERLGIRDTRANVITPGLATAPWNVQLNGEVLEPGNRHFTATFPWRDFDSTDSTFATPLAPPVEGVDSTPNTFDGTNIVVPYRICKEFWFEGAMDPDVIPPIENSDPPFPGFPFEGMQLEDNEEAIIFEAMQAIEAVAPITFVPVDSVDGRDTFPRGTPMLLFVKGAEAEEPFLSDQFLDGDGASFSISAGMTTGPLVLLAPDLSVVSFPAVGPTDTAIPFPWQAFQLIDEEEIPRLDDDSDYITLPGYNPAAFPTIPEGRLPVLDVDDIDNDGVAAELGDEMNPGVMYVDWEPRPFLDRRFGGTVYVTDYLGVDDTDGNGNAFDDDGNTEDGNQAVRDILEGYEISPFTAMIVMHPTALAGGGIGTRAVIIHEILHALGFGHEQQRADRDTYIEVFEENIAPGQLGQFSITGGDLGDYDFESIMHYGPFAFTFNGEQTMRVRPEFRARYGNVIGTATTLSQGDAEGLRSLYGSPSCPTDMDGDLDTDLDDLELFVGYYLANDPRADVNGDLVVNINDFIEFIDGLVGRTCFSPPPQPPIRPTFGPIVDPF